LDDHPNGYACPRCRAGLEVGNERCRCVSCDEEWPVRRGVLRFREQSQYWGEISREEMTTLVERAIRIGWRSALEEGYRDLIPYNRKVYVEREARRADWKRLLPVERSWKVLDAGCGLGSITASLARDVSEIHAFDAATERAEFCAIRAAQEEVGHVQVCVADFFEAPYQAGYFDLVILNGVLEWLAEFRTEGNPERVQIDGLRRVARFLKPGGYLYLAIENRFGLNYLLGRKDPHSGLRFATILPRAVSNLYSRIVLRKPYRVYIHSPKALSRLVTEAGFDVIRQYYPAPHYHLPRFFIPLESRTAWRFFLKNVAIRNSRMKELAHWGASIMTNLSIQGKVAPALSLIARKRS